MIDLGLTVEDLKKPLSELEPVFEKVKAEKPELTPFIYGWGILESNTPVIVIGNPPLLPYLPIW